jgi:hypothetical protein
MIRINIKKEGKITVKSFVQKIDLIGYVLDFIGSGDTKKTAASGASNKLRISCKVCFVRSSLPYGSAWPVLALNNASITFG